MQTLPLIITPGLSSQVLIPSHRSYIDFLIVSYIFYSFQLPVPHIAAGDDFLNMLLVRWIFRHRCGPPFALSAASCLPFSPLRAQFTHRFAFLRRLRNSGAFFMRRSLGEDELYREIFTEYTQRLLLDGTSSRVHVSHLPWKLDGLHWDSSCPLCRLPRGVLH
jgi:hypothetical protein